MSAFLWVLASALMLFVLTMGLVLTTPVKLALTMQTSPKWRLNTSVRLIGGLTPAISFHGDDDGGRPAKARKTRKARKRASRRLSTGLLRAISAAPQFLAESLRCIHLDRLSVDADVGLGDPADTGQFFGMITAVMPAMPSKQNVSIVIRPDFIEPRAAGRLDAELSFVPLALFAPGVRFAWRMLRSRR